MAAKANRVLITGGAGFIGSHLVAHCLDKGNTVHVVARPSSSTARLDAFAGRLEVHRLQLSDRNALVRCLSKARPDQIFHLASRSRWQMEPDFEDVLDSIDEELRGLATLLATASMWPPKVFVRAGTIAEYGPGPLPYTETQREVASSTYGTVMAAGTHYAQMLQRRLSFPVLTARLALIYGPRQSDLFLIPSLIRRCLARQPSVVRNPDARRDLLHVDDAVEALYLLASKSMPNGAIVNVASGLAPTMREVAGLIAHAADADPALITLARGGDEGASELRASPAYAYERFGWHARISLPAGIRRTVEWFREQQMLIETALC